jgi:hypothetical protein
MHRLVTVQIIFSASGTYWNAKSWRLVEKVEVEKKQLNEEVDSLARLSMWLFLFESPETLVNDMLTSRCK